MGFGINAAVMSGVNDGLRQIKNDEWLDQSRQREAATADLNHQVLSGQVEDMNRVRADQSAYRGVGAAAATANPGDKLMPLTAQRDEALRRGDTDTANRVDASIKSMHQEGLIELTRFAMMHGGAFDAGSDAAKQASEIFNRSGTKRIAHGAMSMDKNGNLYAISSDGKQLPPININRLAVLSGLVKPDEYADAGGQPYNKRTGLGPDGKPVARVMKPGEVLETGGSFGTQVPFAPKDSAVVVPEGSNVTTLGPGGVPVQTTGDQPAMTPPTKVRKTISDEVDNGFKGPMGELNGPADVRDRQKVLAEQIWAANKGRNFTEAMSVEAARAAQGGKAPVGTLKLADGSTARGFMLNGQPVFLTPPAPAVPAASAPNAAPSVAPAASSAPPPVPRPAAGAAPSAAVPPAKSAAPARPAGYVEIPPMPATGAGSKAFDTWFEQYGDQYQKNEAIMRQAEAEQAAAAKKSGGLKARLKERQQASFGIGAR